MYSIEPGGRGDEKSLDRTAAVWYVSAMQARSSDVRARFSHHVTIALGGEAVEIMRHDTPVAVLVSATRWRETKSMADAYVARAIAVSGGTATESPADPRTLEGDR